MKNCDYCEKNHFGYKNDCTIRSFADDSRLFKPICTSQDAESLKHDLQNVILWATENNMVLHEDKFELMQYSSSLNSNTKKLLVSLPFNEYIRYYSMNQDPP